MEALDKTKGEEFQETALQLFNIAADRGARTTSIGG
jgi:hypothetical protein